MVAALILKTPGRLSAPLPNTPKLLLAGDSEILTSDRFTGGNTSTITGRTTDAGLGGQKQLWSTFGTSNLGIDGGELVTSDATVYAFSYLETDTADVDLTLSMKVRALPASNAVFFDLFRDTPASDTATRLRGVLNAAGTLSFSHNTPAGSTGISAPISVRAGDTLGLRYNNRSGELSTYLNGVLSSSASTGRKYAGKLHGFAFAGAVPGARFDDLTLSRTIF